MGEEGKPRYRLCGIFIAEAKGMDRNTPQAKQCHFLKDVHSTSSFLDLGSSKINLPL